jgi:hypothetical protein
MAMHPAVSRVTPPAKNGNRRAARPAGDGPRYAHRIIMRHSILILALFLLPSLLLAKGPTSDQVKAVTNAELLGRAIYLQDQAASIATDALLAAVDPGRRKQVIGWIVGGEKESRTVTFVGKIEDK